MSSCFSRTSAVWTMKSAFAKSYQVHLFAGVLDGSWKQFLEDRIKGRRGLLITTPSIARLHSSFVASLLEGRSGTLSFLEMPFTEQSKSLDVVRLLCEEAVDRRLDRQSVLLSVGGGVCCDVVTMAASLFRRGIGHIKIPTTLLGQVDSGVGIKGAVNLCDKKSAIGCYHPPECVVICPSFLRTLPECHLRNGSAEVAKIAIVSDPALFGLLEKYGPTIVRQGFHPEDSHHRQIVWTAAVRMLEQLETNLYENQTFQRLVDFGHTFSPALEAASHFGLQHGEAVAIDMALCAVLAWHLELLSADIRDRILSLLLKLGLPVYSSLLTPQLCENALDEARRHRGGQPNLVLPTGLSGAAFIRDFEGLASAMESSLRWLKRYSHHPVTDFENVSRLAMGNT